MDLPPLAIDIVKDAKTKYDSIPSIHYALDNFNPSVKPSTLKEGLAHCEYTQNSQLIALAAMPKEGQSNKLLFNLNLQELTDAEMLFMTTLFPTILNLCSKDYEIDIPTDLTKEEIFRLAELKDPIFFEQVLEKNDLRQFDVGDLIRLGLDPVAINVLDKLVLYIFTSDVFPMYINQYFIQKNLGLPEEEEPEDILTTQRVVDFKRFIAIIAKKLKYGEDTNKMVEAYEDLLTQISSQEESIG